jgi:hypothetical protein
MKTMMPMAKIGTISGAAGGTKPGWVFGDTLTSWRSKRRFLKELSSALIGRLRFAQRIPQPLSVTRQNQGIVIILV